MKKETCFVATAVLARLFICICLCFHLKQILSGCDSSFGRFGSCQSEIQEHLESHYRQQRIHKVALLMIAFLILYLYSYCICVCIYVFTIEHDFVYVVVSLQQHIEPYY